MPDKTKHLVSPGFLCQQFQKPYFAILKTLADAGVAPVMTIDLCPHYDWNEACRVLGGDETQLPMIHGSVNHE
jgi:hypothetical protein